MREVTDEAVSLIRQFRAIPPDETEGAATMGSTYKDAGVDLDIYEQSMRRIPALLARTRTDRVLELPGGFAGLFRLNSDSRRYVDPVLISGSDGVGTKIKVAAMAGVLNTIGIDLVAMCVNDCLCCGAEPLFFLDYLAMSHDDPDVVEALVEGVSEGCCQAGAALLGGETAIMPDVYARGDFDLAGFCVGVCERDQVLDGTRIAHGDRLIAVPSSGFHSNGYSLLRKVVFEQAGLTVQDSVPELGRTVAEILLTPTRIYASSLAAVMQTARCSVHGIAHITGGGLCENIERLLPAAARLTITLDPDSWEVPAEMSWVQRLGNISTDEMFRVFNMGIGLVLIVDGADVDSVLSTVRSTDPKAFLLGSVTEGERSVKFGSNG